MKPRLLTRERVRFRRSCWRRQHPDPAGRPGRSRLPGTKDPPAKARGRLTQWAYHQGRGGHSAVGPEHDIGAPVAPGAFAAGGLAVCDGHVAMIVGHGMMVEAGYQ
jgi:hypothetical protein